MLRKSRRLCDCQICDICKRKVTWLLSLNGLVASALGIQTRGPRFESQAAAQFHWVATFGKLFTHIASPVSQLQETGVQKGSFWRLSGYGD